MKKIVLFITLLLLIAISCTKEEEPILILSETDINISEAGGTTTVKIVSNNSWSASCADWCTISPTQGNPGETTVTIQVAENTTFAERTGSINFTSDQLRASLNIKQEMNEGIYIPQQEYIFSNNDNFLKFEIKGNVKYDVTIDDNSKEWIIQKNVKSSTETLEFEIKKNTTYDSRTGYISIKEEGGKETRISVSQKQMDGLFVLNKTVSVAAEGGLIDIETLSNVDLELTIPNGVDWIKRAVTKSLDSLKFTLEISSNIDNKEPREAVIYIGNNALSLRDTVKIIQKIKGSIIIPKHEYQFSNGPHTLNFKVQGDVKYTVSIDDNSKEWIVYRASSNGDLAFDIKKNTTYDSRSGYITVREENGKETKITVTQMQKDGLFVMDRSLHIGKEGGLLEIETISNIDLELIIPDEIDWIKKVATKGLDTVMFKVEISSNTINENSREANVFVVSTTSSLKDTVRVIQSGNQRIDFPDATFRSYVLTNFDLNGDGEISSEEAELITEISIEGGKSKIVSFEGIEHFPNLRNLTYYGGKCLKNIDVTKNYNLEKLYLDNNLIEDIDLSHNSKLNYISLYYNKLSSINLENNPLLTYISVSGNNLKNLDLSKNSAIEQVYCNNNKLASLDLSNLSKLKILWTRGNEIEKITFKNNTALYNLDCSGNKISTIDFSECRNLGRIVISENSLKSITVNNMPYLDNLNCCYNQLEEINIISCPEIFSLNISGNKIKDLDLSQQHKLYWLYCSENLLSVLDITECAIEELYTKGNPNLRVIFVPSGFGINGDKLSYDSHTSISYKREIIIPDEKFREYLIVEYDNDSDNILTTAELANIKSLSVKNIGIESLSGLEYMPNLKYLACDIIKDTILNLSNNTELEGIDLRGSSRLKKIYVWPGFPHAGNPAFLKESEATYEEIEYISIKDNNFNGYLLGKFDYDYDGRLSTYEAETVVEIGVSTHNISTIEGIENFPNLTSLSCSGGITEEGLLTSIDISKNPKLQLVYCLYNQLTTIDFSQNRNLKEINISYNNIEALDISLLHELERLNCNNTNFGKIVFKENHKLDYLSARNSKLKELDLSEAENITYVNVSNSALESINLKGNGKLQELIITKNSLINIDLSSQTNLANLAIGNNKLQDAIDVSCSPNIKEIYCKYNPDLKTVYLKEGVNPRVVDGDRGVEIKYR